MLLRADFLNVRMNNGKITDSFRIDKTLKTIDFALKSGGLLTIVSHLGSDGKETLLPVYEYLKKKKIEFFLQDRSMKKQLLLSIVNATQKSFCQNLREIKVKEK